MPCFPPDEQMPPSEHFKAAEDRESPKFHLATAYGRSDAIRAGIEQRFKSQPWNGDQIAAGAEITGRSIDLAAAIVENVKPSRMRDRALEKLEEARMLANLALTHG